ATTTPTARITPELRATRPTTRNRAPTRGTMRGRERTGRTIRRPENTRRTIPRPVRMTRTAPRAHITRRRRPVPGAARARPGDRAAGGVVTPSMASVVAAGALRMRACAVPTASLEAGGIAEVGLAVASADEDSTADSVAAS